MSYAPPPAHLALEIQATTRLRLENILEDRVWMGQGTKILYDFAYCARAEPGAQSRRSSSVRSDHPQSCQYDIPT
jgi:hypothetical protein